MLREPIITCRPPSPSTRIVVRLESNGGSATSRRVAGAQFLLGVDHPGLLAGPPHEQVRLETGRLDALDDLDRPHDSGQQTGADLLDGPVAIDAESMDARSANRLKPLIATPMTVRPVS